MTRQLAQLNIGRLVADMGDPRVAAFVGAIDRVNDIGRRSPGFVWMTDGSGAPGAGGLASNVATDPRVVTNLTVWEDVESLENFVWNTVHRQFYERRQEWFEVMTDQHFVMWWVPAGHRPSLGEALERLELHRAKGDSEMAFGWAYLKEAHHWRAHTCRHEAAE